MCEFQKLKDMEAQYIPVIDEVAQTIKQPEHVNKHHMLKLLKQAANVEKERTNGKKQNNGKPIFFGWCFSNVSIDYSYDGLHP